MSKFKFGAKSVARLRTVHHDMRRVAVRALELSSVDFSVVQGWRTLDEQRQLYGKGRTAAECIRAGVPAAYAKPLEAKVTWTLNSNHLSGNAIDVCPFHEGALNWDDDGKLGLWPIIADAFKQAASELNINIEWGGDWKSKIDRPHFELVAK